MTPERINDDELLNNLETSLLETIETATAELEAVRTVQRLARAGRSGRPRGSKNKPREVLADTRESFRASESDDIIAPADLDAAP